MTERTDPSSNGFATAAVTLAVAGFTLVAIPAGLVTAVVGLRRATAGAPGRARCWLAIALALCWAAAAVYVVPDLVRASDPGCAEYKGPALSAYATVIGDLSGPHPAAVPAHLNKAISALREASARSHSVPAAHALHGLTSQLRVVLRHVRAHTVVPGQTLRALNTDAHRADTACGTLRV